MSNVKWEKSDSISTSSPSVAASSSFWQSLSVACPNKLIVAATYYKLKMKSKTAIIDSVKIIHLKVNLSSNDFGGVSIMFNKYSINL